MSWVQVGLLIVAVIIVGISGFGQTIDCLNRINANLKEVKENLKEIAGRLDEVNGLLSDAKTHYFPDDGE